MTVTFRTRIATFVFGAACLFITATPALPADDLAHYVGDVGRTVGRGSALIGKKTAHVLVHYPVAGVRDAEHAI